jgi:hypothetical protein
MLGMKTYAPDYVAQSRKRIDADVAAFRKLAAAAKKQGGAENALGSALSAFERTYFTDMVLVLDRLFVHRLRMVEGKDTNALSEVRVLSNSMVHNGGTMIEDKAVKLAAERSVLKYQPGETIKLDEAQFVALSSAFFAELDRRFV